jgi:predicted nucleotidyltransferase
MIHTEVQTHLPELRKLLLSKKVESAFLFGSACTDHLTDKSDIDIIIKFKDGIDPVLQGDLWWEIYFSLEELLKRPIDLLTERSIENPYFKSEIEKSKVMIL